MFVSTKMSLHDPIVYTITQRAVLLRLIGFPSSRTVCHVVFTGMQIEGLAMLVASIPARFITSNIEISVSITSRFQKSDDYNPRKQDINIDISFARRLLRRNILFCLDVSRHFPVMNWTHTIYLIVIYDVYLFLKGGNLGHYNCT